MTVMSSVSGAANNAVRAAGGTAKIAALGAGVATGIGASMGIRALLPEQVKADELEKNGKPTLDSTHAAIYGMAIPFSLAAGIGLGLAKRSPTSGITTTSQIVTAALLSTVAGAVINADSDKAGDYVSGIAAMGLATALGGFAGVNGRIPEQLLRRSGLVLFGVAAGLTAPIIYDRVSTLPDAIRNGYEVRER